MGLPATCALLVRQQGSRLAEVLEQSLGAAGVRVTAVASPYEAILEADRTDRHFRYLIVGVDHFGRDEYRLLPMARREWPETTVVAYHSPGFEYKGRLAELVGADVVVAGLDDISSLLEQLASPPEHAEMRPAERPEPAPEEAEPARPAAGIATAPEPTETPEPGAEPPSDEEAGAPGPEAETPPPSAEPSAAAAPAEPVPRAAQDHSEAPAENPPDVEAEPPPPATAASPHLPHVEITDEELRLLLAEDDEEETP